ncbi:MAG: DNA polymerase III subunit beta, partial [Dehalococcoidia bacterium]|nr:DNA polymerase III subunit beta [Dehalococcoidia bacterium]
MPKKATRDDRPVLLGVCLSLGETVEVAAADGFRLAVREVPGSLPHHNKRVILPAGAVRALAHLWKLAGSAPDVHDMASVADLATARRLLRLEYSQTHARFTFGRVALRTQLIQGDFPRYHQLIPEATSQVACMAGDLRRGVDLLARLASGGSGIIRLSWEGDTLTLEGGNEDEGRASTTVPLVHGGGKGYIAVYSRYLRDALHNQEGIVTLGTTTPSSPMTLTL